MAVKAPERQLTVQDVCYLLQLSKQTVLKLMNGEWKVAGGAKLVMGQWRVPTGFFNRWLDSKDVAMPKS